MKRRGVKVKKNDKHVISNKTKKEEQTKPNETKRNESRLYLTNLLTSKTNKLE